MKSGATNRRYSVAFAVIALAAVAAFVCSIFVGSVFISPSELLSSLFSSLANGGKEGSADDVVATIVNFRLLKSVTALLAGMALGCCGLLMQTLFKNPLADPYILGISSASGLGVSLYILGASAFGVGQGTFIHGFGVAGASLAGAFLLALLIIYVSRRLTDNLSLLIFGIMVGSVASALITMLQYLSADSALKAYVLWTMGCFAAVPGSSVAILAGMVVFGLVISVFVIKDLNTLLLGENYAKSLGIDTMRVKMKILVAATLLAGGVTAFCGPIGFVGIAIPHIARFVFRNSNHRVLLPASILMGALVMLLVDIIASVPSSGVVIPVNTVAALMGIPVIIAIIWKHRK